MSSMSAIKTITVSKPIQAVFLDRDGVINEVVYFPDMGMLDCPLNPKQFKLIPGSAEAIKRFNDLGIKVIVVSNQPAIAKGKMTPKLFEQIRRKMKTELSKAGAYVDREYYCFHHPQAALRKYRVKCDCRKPKPGLMLKACKDFNLDPKRCIALGDSINDVEAGKAAGCIAILLGQLKCDLCRLMGEKDIKPDGIFPNLLQASKIVEGPKNGNIS
jgi:D-glycero-D-manno-heptose 1,7-bisphosphate phosphatase